jgi:hypothetical protein
MSAARPHLLAYDLPSTHYKTHTITYRLATLALCRAAHAADDGETQDAEDGAVHVVILHLCQECKVLEAIGS